MENKKKEYRAIALYLPQYHPIPENDKWWGNGFTEWTNVGRAKKLFRGHYQPHVPADLGYYDLRLPEIREAQAQMAKEAGIEGFCYYHYWFGDGKRLLERPFDEVVKLGKPDFPFMLCWANESWHAKFWDINGISSKKTLIEQKYDESDWELHFQTLLPAFKDQRYIQIEGKPAFMIYKPFDFVNINKFIAFWQELAKKNGLRGIYFIGQLTNIDKQLETIKEITIDGFNSLRMWDYRLNRSFIEKAYRKIYRKIFSVPDVVDYSKIYKSFITPLEAQENIFPTIIPNWDHTPRSGKGGTVFKNTNGENFKQHVKEVLKIISQKEYDKRIVFIKSWNEWGEGNYLEPDLKNGYLYLDILQELLVSQK